VPLGEEIPLERRNQRGVPPKSATRVGEACTSDRQPVHGNPDSDSYLHLCLCERSFKPGRLQISKADNCCSVWLAVFVTVFSETA